MIIVSNNWSLRRLFLSGLLSALGFLIRKLFQINVRRSFSYLCHNINFRYEQSCWDEKWPRVYFHQSSWLLSLISILLWHGYNTNRMVPTEPHPSAEEQFEKLVHMLLMFCTFSSVPFRKTMIGGDSVVQGVIIQNWRKRNREKWCIGLEVRRFSGLCDWAKMKHGHGCIDGQFHNTYGLHLIIP